MNGRTVGSTAKRLEDTLTTSRNYALLAVLALVAATLPGATAGHAAPPAEATTSVIVQASDTATATRLVDSVGGTVTHELGIIRAAGARLTATQRDRLAGMQGVLRLYENGRVLVDAVDGESLTVLVTSASGPASSATSRRR